MTDMLTATGLSLGGRLQETSLTLAAGELTCLIGPNGSGKTSLLHALAGINGPSGTVSIDGIDPFNVSPAQRQRLFSYLPASRDLRWPLTARDLVALGSPSAEERTSIPQLLAELELSEFADRRVDRLSTGERSRVLIARALVAQPKVLLLDEPAANLDPLWQLRLMEYLRVLARRNRQTILLAVHDLELARHFPDRLIIMDEGAIAADGEPHALMGGSEIPRVFGIEWAEGRWRPIA
jgi:iron complex transport system ATP-binding protein